MTRVRSSPLPLIATVVGTAALGVLGALVSLSVGESRVPLADVVEALSGAGDTFTRLVVLEFRAPRVAAALVVGACLGLAGAILQSVARNPLASPDLLGINAGASVAAVTVLVLAGSNGGIAGLAASVGLPLAALAGAGLSGLALYVLAIRRRRLDPVRMVVVGVGIAAAGTSLVSWLLTIGDVMVVGPAIAWLSGSLHAATWPRVASVAIAAVVAVPLLAVWGRRLDLLVLGDDAAGGLGLGVDRARILLLLVATALAGAATSLAGALVFLPLCAPQLARALARADRPPLAASALTGAALLVWADVAARMGLSWLGVGLIELPVGVLTACLGAPYLLLVIARQRTEGSLV